MKKYVGRCGCGGIHYSFTDDPMNAVFCYCKECQANTGSDKWFGLWVPIDKLTFTKGTPCVYSRIGDSEKEVNLNFCNNCGTVLCAEVTIGNFYSVAASTLNDSSGLSPQMSIYTASAPSWAVFPEGVPKFDILPPDMGG